MRLVVYEVSLVFIVGEVVEASRLVGRVFSLVE